MSENYTFGHFYVLVKYPRAVVRLDMFVVYNEFCENCAECAAVGSDVLGLECFYSINAAEQKVAIGVAAMRASVEKTAS